MKSSCDKSLMGYLIRFICQFDFYVQIMANNFLAYVFSLLVLEPRNW